MNENTTNTVHSAPIILPAKKSNNILKSVLIFLSGIIFCGLVVLIPALMSGDTTDSTIDGPGDIKYEYLTGDKESKNNILVLYVDQPILTAAQNYDDDLLTALLIGQYIFGYHVKDQLTAVAKDDNVKGVILLINSPGGTIGGARAISAGVDYYRNQTKKPIYAYVQDIGASGAYWASVSTDRIFAEQGSLVGSIGVIMGPFEYYDKLVQLNGVGTENGISITYITAGESKDFGNPTRKITDREMKILQDGINSEYDVFVEYVSSRRNIKEDVIRNELGALVYGAKEAKKYGMIDDIGGFDETISAITKKAGISNDFRVVRIDYSSSLFGSLFAKIKNPNQKVSTDASARKCQLCNKMLFFHGNPLDY